MTTSSTSPTAWLHQASSASMSPQEFRRFSNFVYQVCGIKMPPSKQTMLEARLQKRLRVLGMTSFKQYAEYLFSEAGLQDELPHMIDAVTTNKTDFFREPAHFDFLTRVGLPRLVESAEIGYRRPLQLWSAGCASGEEPYTLAMVLADFAQRTPDFHFSIMATDISTRVLEKARLGIYSEEQVAPVPQLLRRQYLLRSRDRNKRQVRIVPELRRLVQFRRLNFMEDEFDVHRSFDIVFCRNVIIYFDKETQRRFLLKLISHLAPGGYLFLGHSETLSGLDLPLAQVASTIYAKPT